MGEASLLSFEARDTSQSSVIPSVCFAFPGKERGWLSIQFYRLGQHEPAEVIGELSRIPGVAGAHVMAPLNEKALAGTLADARQRIG